jgi:hypothetical protein
MEQEGAEKTEARQILCYLCGLLFNSGSRFSAPRVAVSPRQCYKSSPIGVPSESGIGRPSGVWKWLAAGS